MTEIIVQVGPPGTGKTAFCQTEAAKAQQRYGADKVVACSYSRTGARHVGHVLDLPWDNYATVHGLARRALGDPELAESHLDAWNKEFPQYQLSGHRKTADDAYDTGSEEKPGDRMKGHDADFCIAWQDWKKQCGYVDFDDLLTLALTETECAPGDPAVLLLDEAQDASRKVMEVVWHWKKRLDKLVLSGDPAQSIFNFIGADPLLFQRIWQKFDPERKPLEQSYRLSRAVYQYAREWQRRFVDTVQVDYRPTDEEGSVQGARPLTQWRGHDVERLLEDNPDKTALFLTTCGYLLDPLIDELREAGIPYANPLRITNGKWQALPQKRGRGYTLVDRVLAFSRPRQDIWGDDARFWTAEDLRVWIGGDKLPAKLFKQRGRDRIQALPSTATDVDIARAFREYFSEEALPHLVPTPDLEWYLDLVKGSDNLRDFVQAVIRTRGVKTLEERPRVHVGSVHSYKGGEADIVIVSPDVSKEAYQVSLRDPQAAEEMRRVFYVALTRARSTLLLAQPSTRLHVQW